MARCGSIAGAAEALSLTPSAVSQQLSLLEREAGVPLLDRSPRSVRLTEAGRALERHAAEILVRLDSAEAEIRAIARGNGRELRIAAFPTAAATLAATALRGLSATGDLEVTLLESDPRLSLERLRSGDVDLALLWEYDFVPLPLGNPSLERRTLLDDPIQVLLPRDHAAAARSAVKLGELADESWIATTPRSSCHPFTRSACRAAGFEPHVTAETDDHHVLYRLVANGLGVAFSTRLSQRQAHPEVVARPVWPGLKRRISAAFRTADADRAPVATMVALLEDAGAQERRSWGAEAFAPVAAAL